MNRAASYVPTSKESTLLVDASDEELFRRILRREPEALAVLYDRYSSLVYTATLYLTNDTTTADEVVIAVFETVWHAVAAHVDDQTVTEWILGVTRHHVAAYIERPRQLHQQEQGGNATLQQHNLYSDLGIATPTATPKNIVHAALTSTERTIIALTYHQHLNPGQLAVLLGEPVEHVKMYLREGFFKLQAVFVPGTKERTV